MSILITTYEGTHNHPLPVSATAMASTTSAAASMLLSGSSSSSASRTSGLTSSTANLHGLNLYLPDTSSNSSNRFYFQNSSFSPSPNSHPTITLDLTSTPMPRLQPPTSHSYPSIPQFASGAAASTCLNFTSNIMTSSELPTNSISWGSGYLNYGNRSNNNLNTFNHHLYGRNQTLRPNLDNILSTNYQSYIQKNENLSASPAPPQQMLLPDNIAAAATKAITADPNFLSALASALQSIIGSSNNGGGKEVGSSSVTGGRGEGEGLGQKLKWGQQFPVGSGGGYSTGSSTISNGCATSYMNKTTTGSSQGGGSSLVFLAPPLSVSSPGDASASPADKERSST